MELKNIIKNLGKNKILLAISIAVGMLAGVGFFISPKTYTATGSFYVKRAADTIKFKYFAYEGYYSQQTGISYTNTVIALLESVDIRFEALNKLNLPTSAVDLKRYSRVIKVVKTGPQIITMVVKNNDPEVAKELWNTVANATIEKSLKMNVNGDPMLGISKVSDAPIVRNVYRPLWLCILSGALLAPSLVILFISLRSYFKWK